MGVSRVSYAVDSTKKVEMTTDGLKVEGLRARVQPNRKGFKLGCTFISWEAWDEIRRQVQDAERED